MLRKKGLRKNEKPRLIKSETVRPERANRRSKKPAKKKEDLEFSLNIATLTINARQTAGWPMVDVVSDGRLFRKKVLLNRDN